MCTRSRYDRRCPFEIQPIVRHRELSVKALLKISHLETDFCCFSCENDYNVREKRRVEEKKRSEKYGKEVQMEIVEMCTRRVSMGSDCEASKAARNTTSVCGIFHTPPPAATATPPGQTFSSTVKFSRHCQLTLSFPRSNLATFSSRNSKISFCVVFFN